MGTDIHAHVAAMYGAADDRWGHLTSLDGEPRDYVLFGYMAGVRHNVAPVAEPRGLPAWWQHIIGSLGFMEPKMGWDLGDHTFSWLTANELEAAITLAEVESGAVRPYWRGVVALMRGIAAEGWGAAGVAEVVLVFGFDS